MPAVFDNNLLNWSAGTPYILTLWAIYFIDEIRRNYIINPHLATLFVTD
jgi:hypothetical protein